MSARRHPKPAPPARIPTVGERHPARGRRRAAGLTVAVVVLALLGGALRGFGPARLPAAGSPAQGPSGLAVPGSPSTAKASGTGLAQGTRVDIARLNLVAAEGLPGAEGLQVEGCLARLDEWAERARSETERHAHRFRQNPAEYEHSEGYFRLLMLAVVVCEDFGVRYNPGRISAPPSSSLAPLGGEGGRRPGEEESRTGDGFFADSRDIFLHGLLGERRLGTCSSMPVLYVALARRLGYPVSLVTTKGHLFVRWEGQGERFNVECTGHGMNRYDDAHYRQWPFALSEQEMRENAYLQSLTAAGEAAVFLSLRAECLREAGRFEEARQCYAGAAKLAPEVRLYSILAGQASGPLAGPLLLPAPDLTPAPARASTQPAGFGVSSVPLPEDPNPLMRLQQ